MEKTLSGWTVIDRDAAVLSLAYAFNDRGNKTNSFVARMGNGQLMVMSPPRHAPEQAFAELAEFGDIGAIVANNGFHHLGLLEWRKRFPSARVFAPREAVARIKKKNPDTSTLTFESLDKLSSDLLDDRVTVTEVPNTKCGEMWAVARIAGGNAWFVSDILANLPEVSGPLPQRLLFKLTKSAPGFRVFNLMLNFTVKDKKQVLAQLAEAMRSAPPSVIVPCHGDLLDQPDLADDVQRVLRS
jgi:hypothetical protein